MSATAQQVGLLHHTLGLRVDSRTPYRNHFVADEKHHDMPDLRTLVGLGLMARSPTPKFCDTSAMVFHVTEAGKALALDLLPEPPPRTKYLDWIAVDSDRSFGEFLCGNRLPKVESESDYRLSNGRYRYFRRHRMYRLEAGSHWRREVEGAWCGTKKGAKASYKAALAKFNTARSTAA